MIIAQYYPIGVLVILMVLFSAFDICVFMPKYVCVDIALQCVREPLKYYYNHNSTLHIESYG